MYRPFISWCSSSLRSIIAPPLCASCKSLIDSNFLLCDRCVARIQPIVSLPFQVTKTYTVSIFAITRYEEPIKSLIVAKSWSDIVASRVLGELAWQHTAIRHIPCDVVVPIPLHWTRYAYRGFNQAEEMGRIIAQRSNKPLVSLLKRIKRTPILAAFSAEKRSELTKEAFELTPQTGAYQGKHILLIDDVFTTGSTLRAAIKELKKIKPASISVLVACRR